MVVEDHGFGSQHPVRRMIGGTGEAVAMVGDRLERLGRAELGARGAEAYHGDSCGHIRTGPYRGPSGGTIRPTMGSQVP